MHATVHEKIRVERVLESLNVMRSSAGHGSGARSGALDMATVEAELCLDLKGD